MQRISTKGLAAAAVILLGTAMLSPSAHARDFYGFRGGHFGFRGGPRFGIGIGPWFGSPFYGYYPGYYPPPAYYYPPYYTPGYVAPAYSYVEPDPQPGVAPPSYSQSYCRPYHSTITVNGHRQPVSGTACRQPNGTWRLMN
jgi:hypothetical protein